MFYQVESMLMSNHNFEIEIQFSSFVNINIKNKVFKKISYIYTIAE